MIRIANESDAAEVRRIYAPSVTEGVTSFELTVPSEPEMRQRIVTTLERYPWLVDDEPGQLAGFSYATAYRAREAYQWTVEVSIYVDQAFRREGRASSLYLRLFEILRQQGFHAALAGIAVPNPPSQALHASVGFVPMAIFPALGYKAGAWRDVGWWLLRLRDLDEEPTEPPVPFARWRLLQDSLTA